MTRLENFGLRWWCLKFLLLGFFCDFSKNLVRLLCFFICHEARVFFEKVVLLRKATEMVFLNNPHEEEFCIRSQVCIHGKIKRILI